MSPSLNAICYGADAPLSEPIQLRAGPLSLLFQEGSLRHIRFGDSPIVSRIYVALRSENWRSISALTTLVSRNISDSSFQLRFENRHTEGAIDFSWTGSVSGHPDGQIQFSMDGIAHTSFLKNRIGFCILHPTGEFAGTPCTIEKIDGSVEHAAFPAEISPHQPFLNVRSISTEVFPGIRVKIRCEGDTFETEDQRNWADASFKTYSTPLALSHPVEIARGTSLSQTITLTLEQSKSIATNLRLGAIPELSLVIGGTPRPLPAIGLSCSNLALPLPHSAVDRLRALGPSHLRVELGSFSPEAFARLHRGLEEANQVGVPVEIALFLSNDPKPQLHSLRQVLRGMNPRIARWLVFSGPVHTTTPADVQFARNYLADLSPDAKFVGGTDENFAELNRFRPPIADLDGVTFSLNPQEHADDHDTLVENLTGLGESVKAAYGLANGLPVSVSPISFKPRYHSHVRANANHSQRLPDSVDARQMSLFGAAWTVGSLKYISEAGARTATYFETCGWKGVMEAAEGSPLPSLFPSIPGSVFPLFHVLADFCEFAGGEIIPTRSSRPHEFEGLTLRKNGRVRVLISNFCPQPKVVNLFHSTDHNVFCCRHLCETTALAAMETPEGFRDSPKEQLFARAGKVEVGLPPFSVLTIDSA